MIAMPMLSDFAVRLAFGVAVLLLGTSWRAVPLPFFRTHCQILLGLLVLAALDQSRLEGFGWGLWILIACAVLSYVATITWGLGLPQFALPATGLIMLGSAVWLALASRADLPAAWAFGSANRYVSGFILGAILTAMLLGHHYLAAPAMSIKPLERSVQLIGWGLALRVAVAFAGVALVSSGRLPEVSTSMLGSSSPLFFLMRWGIGFAGPAVAAFLAWKTARIRSTQSATGILYVA
ncbi:MAG: hypothetical protein JO161_09380, partial [Planctomycetaceae bacterium]|nr:hypothetical protein [Planctomycetaceae bacterium]